jgi:hypothetical protein
MCRGCLEKIEKNVLRIAVVQDVDRNRYYKL